MHIQGKGASHFAQLLLNAKDNSLQSDPQPPQSPVLSESSPATGPDLPGQAGSVLSCIVAFALGILHGVFRVRLFGFCGFPQSSFVWNLVKRLLTHPFLRRWSRFRHKRIRGIGSQAASRRKKPPFSPHWKMCFQPSFVRDRMSRQRSAFWQTTCLVFVFTMASFSMRGTLRIFQPWCVIGTLRDDIEAASEVFISLWSAVSLSQFPRTIAAPFPRICVWGLLSLCSFLCVYGFRHVLGGCCASVAPRALRRFCKEYISSYRKSLQKWLRELYNINMNNMTTNEDNNHDTNYINKYTDANHDTRKLHE